MAMNKMERLTFEGNFCDIARCEDTPGGSFCEYGCCDQRRVWERLKAYEDVGSVEEFAAYKQAESEGRLVVRKRPPVKRGDTVYTITNEEIMEREVIEITCGDGWCRIACHASQGRQYAFGILDIGKTVFLTRAEAEAALAAKEGGNDD